MVVVIVAEIPANLPPLEIDGAQKLSPLEHLIARGNEFLTSLTGPIVHQWTVGCAPKNRFPVNDVREIDGLDFYLPDDMIARVQGRVLDIKDNVLQFEPEMQPLITQT